MSSHGYIKLYRSIFKHEFFREKAFSDREAWIWMICEAAWKPRGRRIERHYVQLERGQLAASVRYLADIWGWTIGPVRNFLDRAEKDQMISKQTDGGITVITILNYDEFQGDDDDDMDEDDPKSSSMDQASIKHPSSSMHNTEEINKSKREEGKTPIESGTTPLFGGEQALEVTEPRRGKAKRGQSEYSAAFEAWWPRYPRHDDKRAASKAFERVLREQRGTIQELDDGADAYSAERRGEDPKYTKMASTWLNNDCWNNRPKKPHETLGSATRGVLSLLGDDK